MSSVHMPLNCLFEDFFYRIASLTLTWQDSAKNQFSKEKEKFKCGVIVSV